MYFFFQRNVNSEENEKYSQWCVFFIKKHLRRFLSTSNRSSVYIPIDQNILQTKIVFDTMYLWFLFLGIRIKIINVD